jgi:ankyrin repeat protein
LHLASRNDHVAVVKCLVEDGNANVETGTSSTGCTALHFAVRFGHLEIVQYLLRYGNAKVDAVSTDGQTALHYATMNGYYDVVRYLLKDGNTNPGIKMNHGLTALHIAGANNSLEIAKLLLAYPNSTNATNQKGESPLEYTRRIMKDRNNDYNFQDRGDNSDMIALLQQYQPNQQGSSYPCVTIDTFENDAKNKLNALKIII